LFKGGIQDAEKWADFLFKARTKGAKDIKKRKKKSEKAWYRPEVGEHQSEANYHRKMAYYDKLLNRDKSAEKHLKEARYHREHAKLYRLLP